MEGIQVVQAGAEVNHAFGNEGFTALYMYIAAHDDHSDAAGGRWERFESRLLSGQETRIREFPG